jgi:hypothetical protein
VNNYDTTNVMKSFGIGYTTSLIANIVTHPFQNVRRHMYLTNGTLSPLQSGSVPPTQQSLPSMNNNTKKLGATQSLLHLIRQEGISSVLLRGQGVSPVRAVAGATSLIVFDGLQHLFAIPNASHVTAAYDQSKRKQVAIPTSAPPSSTSHPTKS